MRPSASDLTDLPVRMRKLPVDEAGRPIPWFATEIDGKHDFRVITPEKIHDAIRMKLCWVCGLTLGSHVTFVAGPMCGVNRTSSEPPSHLDCAVWSATHCPFLNNPNKERRDTNLPGEVGMPGIGIMRNPGVTMVWTTRHGWGVRVVPNGILFGMGDPHRVLWFRDGRPATRVEVSESILTGLPELKRLARTRDDRRELARRVRQLRPWLP